MPASRIAAASGAAVALALAAPATYNLLSTATLPPLGLLAKVLAGLLAGSVVLAKAVYGDNVHLELHKGRLYLQLGVPASGPPLQPGSIVTRPTGDVRGNGAYATTLIPAGTHIADYMGEQLVNAAFFDRYPDGVGDYVMAIDRDTVIDATAWVTATDVFHPVHMNHSRSRHNVVRYYERSKGRVAFFAERDIQPGEELLFSYGADYWRGREHLELP